MDRASYTLAPLGMTVRMMMSARAVFEPTKPRFGVTLVEGAPEPPRMTPARKRALEIAGDGAIRAKAALALAAECSSGVVDGLVASGNLVEVAIPDKRPPLPDPHYRVTEFGTEQAAAVHALRSAVDGGELLDDAARRRHRLRQDGGLFRGGGAHAGARPAGG